MKNFEYLVLTAAMLVSVLSVPGVRGQSQPPASSVKSSPSSATRASDKVPGSEFRVPGKELGKTRNSEPETRNLIPACMAAVEELGSSRRLIVALEAENTALAERLASEKRAAEVLGELIRTRSAESEALRSTVTAKNEAIAAKDAVIAAQDKLADQLKKKKPSPWRRLGDILMGAAVFSVLK